MRRELQALAAVLFFALIFSALRRLSRETTVEAAQEAAEKELQSHAESPRETAYDFYARVHPDGGGLAPDAAEQASYRLGAWTFPQDDPRIGAKKGQPGAPYMSLTLARSYRNAGWTEDNLRAMRRELSSIVAGYDDPSLQVVDATGTLRPLYAVAGAMLLAARQEDANWAALAERLLSGYPDTALEDGLHSHGEARRFLLEAGDPEQRFLILDELPGTRYESEVLRVLFDEQYERDPAKREAYARRILASKAGPVAKARANLVVGELLEKKDDRDGALAAYRAAAASADDATPWPADDPGTLAAERVWALEGPVLPVFKNAAAACGLSGKTFPFPNFERMMGVTGWTEQFLPPPLPRLAPAPELSAKAVDVPGPEGCGVRKRLSLPREGLFLDWDRGGCPTDESPSHDAIKVVDQKTGAVTGSISAGWYPVSVFCAENVVVLAGLDGPWEYGNYSRTLFFWHLPTGQASLMRTSYSGGKGCDDGESGFEPIDILKNVGTPEGLRVLAAPGDGPLVLAGARGAVAVDVRQWRYWGVDLATGKPRPIRAGNGACGIQLR